MTEPDTSELTPAEENAYYLVAKQGKGVWNKWTADGLKLEQKKTAGLNPHSYYSTRELGDLAEKIGLPRLPDHQKIDFRNLRFLNSINFSGFVFLNASFSGSDFSEHVDFSKAVFLGNTDFSKCKFRESSKFDEVVAYEKFDISESSFDSIAVFNRAVFEVAEFNNAQFSSLADFTRAEFKRPVTFLHSVFEGSANFNNVTFGATTSFNSVTFSEVPMFHEAQLHQDTSFSEVRYDLSEGRDSYHWKQRSRSWRALKQKMNTFQSHQEELQFFANELDARARSEENKVFVIMVALYKALCGFGTLIRRPILLLLALWATSSFFYYIAMNSPSVVSAASISFSNTIPFVGQSRLIADVALSSFSEANYGLVYAFSVVQGLLSAVLLFLVLLGIRNHFRLK